MKKNFEELTVVVLKEQAKALGIKNYSKMRKAELVEALNNLNLNTEVKEMETMELKNVNVIETKEVNVEMVNNTINAGTTKENGNEYRRNLCKEVIAKLNNKEEVSLEDIKEVAAYLRAVKHVSSMDFCDVSNFRAKGLKSANALIEKIVESSKSTFRAKKDFKAMKKWSKDLKVVVTRQVEFFRVQKDSPKIRAEVRLMPSQESDVLRNITFKQTKMADSNYGMKTYGTDELLTVTLNKGLIGKSESLPALNTAFELISSVASQGIYILISKNGVGRYSRFAPSNNSKKEFALKEGEIAYKYEFIDISGSGLRSASLTLAATKRYTKSNGYITYTNCDRREDILDASTYGGWKLTFKELKGKTKAEIFKEFSKLQIFKNLNREANGNAPSKVGFEVKNALVLDNIAAYSMFYKNNYNVTPHNNPEAMSLFEKFMTTKDKEERKEYRNKLEEMDICLVPNTRDGNIFGDAYTMTEFYKQEGVNVRYSSVCGTTNQSRGIGSLKSSITFKRTEDLRLIAEYNLSIGNTVNYVIFNGKKMSFNDLTDDMLQDLLDNLQVVADRNSIKLSEHGDNTRIVFLKMAYESDTSLSQILNLAMMEAAPKETLSLLQKKFVNELANEFSKVGITFEVVDGKITNSVFSLDAIKKMNNSSQIMEHLFYNDPERIMSCFPYAVRSIMNNTIKSVANLLTSFNLKTDAKYAVIQSDIAVLFGFRILNDDEIYLSDNSIKAKRCSAIRQPMSGTKAVTTFNVVTLKEIAKRVNKLKTTTAIKNAIFNDFRDAKGYNIIPASEYYMEKHDGLDFDIDAMMFYFEEDVVDILSKVKEQGIIITRSEKDYIMTPEEEAIKRFAENVTKDIKLVRPNNKVIENLTKTEEEGIAYNIMDNMINKSKEELYTMSSIDKVKIIHEYYKNPIANVGVVTSSFYNNIMLGLELRKNGENAERIIKILRAIYDDKFDINNITPESLEELQQKNDYISPLNKDSKEIVINKTTCTDIIFNFVESKKTPEMCQEFIEDCCYANRYPNETSIDSAKNGYYMLNYFNHNAIPCLGIDKNMKFICVPHNDEIFNECADYGFSFNQEDFTETNSFYNSNIYKDCLKVLGYKEEESFLKLPMIMPYEKPLKGTGIKDDFAKLKLGLVDVCNMVIVLAEQAIKNFVASPVAIAHRQDVIEKYNENAKLYENKNIMAKSIFMSIENSWNKLSKAINNQNISDEYKTLIAKEYIESCGKAQIRNFAEISFNGLSKTNIGINMANFYIEKLSSDLTKNKITTINPGIIKVLEEEFILGLQELGFDNMGVIAEEIDFVSHNVNEIIGEEVEIVDGTGVIDDVIIKSTNKKLNLSGYIEEANHKLLLIAERDYSYKIDAANNELGITFGVAELSKAFDYEDTINNAVSLEFRRELSVNNGKEKKYNAIIATLKDGSKRCVCTLIANEHAKQFLAAASDLNLLTADIVSIYSDCYSGTTYSTIYFADLMQYKEVILEKALSKRVANKTTKTSSQTSLDSSLIPQEVNEEVAVAKEQEIETVIGEVVDDIAPTYTA